MQNAIFLLVGIAMVCVGCEQSTESPEGVNLFPTAKSDYVGGSVCGRCHSEELSRWENSHHDLAMQTADESTVIGNFDNAALVHDGFKSEFIQRDGAYWIRTQGSSETFEEYKVIYTFGIEPLQQYVVELPDGRYQVPPIAWDTRGKADGGQRWFDVNPAEDGAKTGPLHWTGVFQNWNTSCAGCHSTNVVKNYAAGSDTYDTTYSSIDVDCEACHGPGSRHVADPSGSRLLLARDDGAKWLFPTGESIARRVPPRDDRSEIETCAQCHSRRSQLVDRFEAGKPLLDHFRLELLDKGLYHADGQVLDEVYVYGSFLQSRMHAASVSCSDCHDPHSNRLRAKGNAVCTQCHLPVTYDTPAHHHHPAGSGGSDCVDCHMPAKTYMAVDSRRDHSFRIPRPDLSSLIGVPNACSGCHVDYPVGWAADIVRGWYPDGHSGTAHYGEAIAAGRSWDRDRAAALTALYQDTSMPAIVRATAIRLLGQQPDPNSLTVIKAALDADHSLLQLAAIDYLAAFPVDMRLRLARPLLSDPSLSLRTAAARQIASTRHELPQSERKDLDAALAEYRDVQSFNADRAEGWVNIAGLQFELGEYARAETTLKTAIERHPHFVASYINLADLYRLTGRDDKSQALLTAAIDANPEDPTGWLALGLAQVRSARTEAALGSIRRAVDIAPDDPYYRYVLGLALDSTSGSKAALEVLADAHKEFPAYRDITFALATIFRDTGDIETALAYANELLDQSGGDAAAQQLVRELENRLRGND